MAITNIDDTINRWVRQADHDLENAKKNIDIEAFGISREICFL